VDVESSQDTDALVFSNYLIDLFANVADDVCELIFPVCAWEDLLRFEVGEYFEEYFEQGLVGGLDVVGQF
jgi:hypothetical protein